MIKNIIIWAIILLVFIILVGIYRFNITNHDIYINHNNVMIKYDDAKRLDELEKHCVLMPDMPGCEQFNKVKKTTTSWDLLQGDDRMMTSHANMISDELSFIAEMIPHHQEAINTSRSLLAITQNTSLRPILQNIVSWQTQEIEIMKWRFTDYIYPSCKEHHQTFEECYTISSYAVPYMPMMRDTSTINAITTIEKMRLEDMIIHHQWAIDMAMKILSFMKQENPLIKLTKEAMNHRNEVKAFADSIINTQTKEISEFKKLLKTY